MNNRLKKLSASIIYWIVVLVISLPAQSKTTMHSSSIKEKIDCIDPLPPNIHCGKTPSIVFDTKKRLWAVFELNGKIYVNYSDDNGGQFSPPVAVNSQAETIYTNGENRPKIALGNNKEIYVSWTQKTSAPYTGNIRFSRSIDSGKSFSPPVTVNDDGLLTSHRFDSLVISNSGTVFLVWLDKREMAREKIQARHDIKSDKTKKIKMRAGVYYAVSTDSGKTFQKNKKLADNSCVCCRIAAIPTNDDGIAVFWRHIFEKNTRDHAFAIIKNNQIIRPAKRATKDQWRIDACPHHGPSLTQDLHNNYHMLWFTASENRKGIFYGQYSLESGNMENVVNISNTASASHPFIISEDKRLIIVWKEFDGVNTNIYNQVSENSGIQWQKPIVVAKTKGKSDHPLLVQRNNTTWLSWHTDNEGLRLIELDD